MRVVTNVPLCNILPSNNLNQKLVNSFNFQALTGSDSLPYKTDIKNLVHRKENVRSKLLDEEITFIIIYGLIQLTSPELSQAQCSDER